MENNVEMLYVGQKRNSWKGMADGYIMEYNALNGLTLCVFFQHPTPDELEQMKSESSLKIGFTDIDGVGFFTVKFGNLPWGDCAFSPNLYDEKPEFPELAPGKGLALNIIVIDGAEGEVKYLRLVGLGVNFSRQFIDWCNERLKHEISRTYYNRTIDKAYKQYLSEELARKKLFEYYVKGQERAAEEKEKE